MERAAIVLPCPACVARTRVRLSVSIRFSSSMIVFSSREIRRLSGERAAERSAMMAARSRFSSFFSARCHFLSIRSIALPGVAAFRLLVLPTYPLEEIPVCPLKKPRLPSLENDEPLREGVEDHLAVGGEYHGPLEGVDSLNEGIDGFHVEVVGRLVEEQQVCRRGEHLSEEHAALLPAGKHRDLLQGPVALEEHRAADVPGSAAAEIGCRLKDLLFDRLLRR